MIPALLYIQIRRPSGWPIPVVVPIVLLWPFVALIALCVWPASWLSRAGSRFGAAVRAARLMLGTLAHLSGLRIDVESAGGERVRVRAI